jgi:hypothetical protein
MTGMKFLNRGRALSLDSGLLMGGSRQIQTVRTDITRKLLIEYTLRCLSKPFLPELFVPNFKKKVKPVFPWQVLIKGSCLNPARLKRDLLSAPSDRSCGHARTGISENSPFAGKTLAENKLTSKKLLVFGIERGRSWVFYTIFQRGGPGRR